MSEFDVKKLKTPDECRTFMKNARDRNREDLRPGAFRRLCELESGQHPDPIVVEFWQAIAALEEVRRQTHGKTVRANRTRSKVIKDMNKEDLTQAQNFARYEPPRPATTTDGKRLGNCLRLIDDDDAPGGNANAAGKRCVLDKIAED
jgi:hypothetical protein